MKENILYLENGFYSSPLILGIDDKPKKYKFIKDILKDLVSFYNKKELANG